MNNEKLLVEERSVDIGAFFGWGIVVISKKAASWTVYLY
jgi:hypothetical protein